MLSNFDSTCKEYPQINNDPLNSVIEAFKSEGKSEDTEGVRVITDLTEYSNEDGRIPILVFGATQVGKSTLINLISRTKFFGTGGLKSEGETSKTQILSNVRWRGKKYDLIDTVGLNEAKKEEEGGRGVDPAVALKNILSLSELSYFGLSLAIYVRKKGAITNIDQANCALFSKALAPTVPLIIVETGFDAEPISRMTAYSSENLPDFKQRLGAVGHVAVCTKQPSEVESFFVEGYTKMNNEAMIRVWNEIGVQAREPPIAITDSKGWITAWDIFCVATGLPLRASGYQDVGTLMREVGLTREEAHACVTRFIKKDIGHLLTGLQSWIPEKWYTDLVGVISNAYLRYVGK